MTVAQHNEHSFDLDLLLSAKNPIAIDVGCRGFSIARQLLPLGVRVLSLDIDTSIEVPIMYPAPELEVQFLAMLGENDDAVRRGSTVGIKRCGDPAATCVTGVHDFSDERVRPVSLRTFLVASALPRIDLLKLDCEGSEYGIMEDIARADKPLARQVTVEYHDHCGKMPPGGPMWFDQIAQLLSRNYQIVKHQRETPPWGGQPSYVDCLYVAREW